MCTQETTATTSIPGATNLELQMQDLLVNELAPEMMRQSGYEMVEQPILNSEEQQMYSELRGIERTNIGAWYSYNNSWPNKEELEAKYGPGFNAKYRALGAKLVESGNPEDPSATRLSPVKAPTPEIAEVVRNYGPDSPEYKEAIGAWEETETKQAKTRQEITTQFMDNSLKFLQGDLSMTEEQQASMQEFFAPTREAVENMYSNIGQEIDKFEEQINTFNKEYDAVQQKMFEQGIEDFGNQATMKVLNQAASLGRDPSDPDFQAQLSDMITKQATSAGMQLRSEQLQRRTQQQGQLFQTRLGAAEAEGAAKVGIEDQARNLRTGMLTGGGSLAGQSTDLVNAINQQRIANLGGVGNIYGGQQQGQQQLRMAQQTTTQTSTPSMLEVGLGVASAGLGAYTGMQQASAMRTMANKYQGG